MVQDSWYVVYKIKIKINYMVGWLSHNLSWKLPKECKVHFPLSLYIPHLSFIFLFNVILRWYFTALQKAIQQVCFLSSYFVVFCVIFLISFSDFVSFWNWKWNTLWTFTSWCMGRSWENKKNLCCWYSVI